MPNFNYLKNFVAPSTKASQRKAIQNAPLAIAVPQNTARTPAVNFLAIYLSAFARPGAEQMSIGDEPPGADKGPGGVLGFAAYAVIGPTNF